MCLLCNIHGKRLSIYVNVNVRSCSFNFGFLPFIRILSCEIDMLFNLKTIFNTSDTWYYEIRIEWKKLGWTQQNF